MKNVESAKNMPVRLPSNLTAKIFAVRIKHKGETLKMFEQELSSQTMLKSI